MNDQIKKPGDNAIKPWRIVLWLLVVWGFSVFFLKFYGPSGQQRSHSISYSQFKQSVKNDNVSEITVEADRISGVYKEPVKRLPPGAEQSEKPDDKQSGQSQEKKETSDKEQSDKDGEDDEAQKIAYHRFTTVKPPFQDTELMTLLEKHGVAVYAESQEGSKFWLIVVNILPWLLIVGFIIWSSKKFQERMGGGKGGMFGFGKSKAKLYTKEKIDVDYDDVAGLENAKKELREVVEFLKDPSKFQALGGELPKGLLLVGKPGVGKTLLARSTAGEAGVPFYSISGSEFIEMFVGVGASRVRDMFKKAKKDAPSIIFIDEIDSIGRTRGTGVGGGHDEREQTLNQILAEMDGFSPRESTIVLAATNRPDVLDPALVRPGRFDRRITLDLPQKRARKAILEIHTRDVPMADDVDLARVADMTVGFSGADLKNLANEAALLAARKGKEKVDMEDFAQGRDKILMGIEKEDIVSEHDREIVAYHESGHALMALILPGADPLEKVTIVPRGKALGATEQIPEEDRLNLSRKYLLNRIAVMLAGRAAEIIQFDDITNGAADDLKKATHIARQMVCQWGMSEKLGPTTFKSGEQHPFIGKEMTEPKDFSEHTAQIIDDEISNITRGMEKTALDALEKNKDKLDALAEALLEHETLTREEIDEIVGEVETAEVELKN